MLELEIPEREYFDDRLNEFIYIPGKTLFLEHSLISLSKWESKWKKPFLDSKQKTYEESVDYIRCMTLNTNVDPKVYYGIDQSIFNKVSTYMEDTMTATWFNDDKTRARTSRGQVVTSELIYYWMVAFGISFECQKWHLNRLLTLIRICEIKNAPPKKMKQKDVFARNKALNSARKRSLGTNG